MISVLLKEEQFPLVWLTTDWTVFCMNLIKRCIRQEPRSSIKRRIIKGAIRGRRRDLKGEESEVNKDSNPACEGALSFALCIISTASIDHLKAKNFI